jgi:hypothetical protein
MVLAKFEADQCWYRAKVINLLPNQMVHVLYVDFGNSDSVPIKK